MESLRNLASKLGVTQEADTIEELINLMNEKIGANKGNDISEALYSYAEAKTPINTETEEPTD